MEATQILKINQPRLAEKLGISQSYVSRILAGKRQSKKYEQKIQQLLKEANIKLTEKNFK